MREDWEEVELGDITEFNPKILNKDKIDLDLEVQFLPMRMVEEEVNKIHLEEIRKFHEVQKKSYTYFSENDVLFAKVTPCMENGKIAIANGLKNKIGFGSSEFHVFRCHKAIENRYLFHFIVQESFRRNAQHAMTGAVGLRRVPKFYLIHHKIPLSPLPEQRAIVTKIEELFSDLDKGISDLKKAQDQLKVYRQAVLKKAFENLEKETTLEEIKEDSLIGLVRASGLQNSNGEGTAYLKMDKIDMIGNVDLEHLVYVETNEDEIEKYALKTGDILLNTRNSYELVGKTGIVRKINKTVVFNNNIMRIRVNESYDPYFICYQLISPFVRKQMDKFKKATTSVCALYQRNLFPLKLKVTDIKEQHQIVQEIESRLSVCDKVEESITESLEKAKALRQSILKKAFEGTLLSREEIAACKAAPDYEPASVLLERIKAEKKK